MFSLPYRKEDPAETHRYSNFSIQRMERGGADAVLALAGLTAVTLTSGVSAYRAAAAGDVGSAAFVGVSYAALLLLFRSLRGYERLLPPRQAADTGDDADADGSRVLAFAGLTAVTLTSGVSAYRAAAAGDVGSAAFVGVTYAALLLLFRSLRAYERLPAAPGAADDDDGRRWRRPAVKREVWALCTLLTAMFMWKVASVVPWPLPVVVGVWAAAAPISAPWPLPVAVGVWAAAAATSVGGFALLFRQQRRLRELEQGGSGRNAKIKDAAWALTPLLITAMFDSYTSGMTPLVVFGALVFVDYLREFGLGGQYADLVKMGFGVAACDSALAHHHARGDDAASLPFVFVAYAGFVALAWLFLRRFDGRARGAGGQ